MSSEFLFGMSEPSIWGTVLAYLIVGLFGFALCYIHRYLVFAVVPIFIWVTYYMVSELFQTPFSLTEKRFGCFLVLIDFLAVIFGAVLSWKKHKIERTDLK